MYIPSFWKKFNFSLDTFQSKNENTVRSTILLKIEHICLEKIPNYNNGNMWVVDFWIIFVTFAYLYFPCLK